FYFHEAAASSAFYMGSRELGAGRYPSARAFFQLADKFRKLDKNLAEDARFRNIPHFVRLAERRAAMGAIKPEFTNRFLVLCIARAESESSRKTGRDFPGVDYRTTRQDFEAIQSLEGAMRTMVEVYTGGRMSLEFQNHYVDGVLRDTRASGESVVTADLNEIDPPLTDILYEEIDKSDSVWILWNASGSIGGPGPGVREYPLIPYSGLNLPMRGYLEGPTKNRNVSYFMYAWLQTLLARTGATAGQDPARAFPEAASLSAEDMFEYILGKHIPRTLDSKGWSKDGLGWRHLSYREEYRLNIPKDAWLKLSKRILGISVDARKDSQVLLRQAEEALKSGDTQTADLCYARALDKNPSLSGPRRYNAERAEKSGNWNAGAAHYADLFEVTGDWHWAQKAGELFLFRMKNEKDGDHYLQTALDLAWKTEDRAAIRDRWTAYYLDKGDLEKAARMRAKEVNYRAPVSDRMRPGMKLAGQRGIRVIRGRTISLSSVPAVSPKEY
ncbi:MAG: hypothetical protein HY042_00755, partial [Spirochaetia bacterium]|nr:hypothetical protein [Spirochaetia bacterium]